MADFTGRGAQRSRAFLHQDVVVCVPEDSATNAERNLASAGRADPVRLQRDAIQRAMGPQLIAAVERLTGRDVRTLMSGTDEPGGSSIEAFVLQPERDPTPVALGGLIDSAQPLSWRLDRAGVPRARPTRP